MKKSDGAARELKEIAIGILWCFGLLLAGSALVAWLIHGQVFDAEMAKYGVVGTLLVSSFVSTAISNKGKQQGWKMTIFRLAGMILVLILGNLILGIGEMNGLLQSGLVMAGGSGCAILVQTKPKKSKRYARRKI